MKSYSSEKIFYVYVHRRKTDGTIFYVGKGSKNRFSNFRGRGKWWSRIAAKHGVTPQIVCSNLSEKDAFDLEMALIEFIGRENLCNGTDGGEGLSGYVPTQETLKKLSISSKGRKTHQHVKDRIREAQSVKTYCSNGMVFSSATSAAKWVAEVRGQNARQSVISRCASGGRNHAYGFAWSYDGVPEFLSEEWSSIKRKRQSLAKLGKRANNAQIVECIETGMRFDSMLLASMWLKDIGYPKASSSSIVAFFSGRNKSAYGYTWKKIEEKNR